MGEGLEMHFVYTLGSRKMALNYLCQTPSKTNLLSLLCHAPDGCPRWMPSDVGRQQGLEPACSGRWERWGLSSSTAPAPVPELLPGGTSRCLEAASMLQPGLCGWPGLVPSWKPSPLWLALSHWQKQELWNTCQGNREHKGGLLTRWK